MTDISDDGGNVGTARERGYRMPDGVDGMLKGNGVLRFNEVVDM